MTSGTTGYNWRNTLSDFASISGILAGFCVAFIGVILSRPVGETLISGPITFENVAVSLVGISAALFIAASQFFLRAKDSVTWNLPKEYERSLKKGFKEEGKEWEEIKEDALKNCKSCERYGRILYNAALITMYLGIGFIVAPYNGVVAAIISVSGISLEIWQSILKIPSSRTA